jgi:hypothetical protein
MDNMGHDFFFDILINCLFRNNDKKSRGFRKNRANVFLSLSATNQNKMLESLVGPHMQNRSAEVVQVVMEQISFQNCLV